MRDFMSLSMHFLGRRAKIQGETRERQFLDEMGNHLGDACSTMRAPLVPHKTAISTQTHLSLPILNSHCYIASAKGGLASDQILIN